MGIHLSGGRITDCRLKQLHAIVRQIKKVLDMKAVWWYLIKAVA